MVDMTRAVGRNNKGVGASNSLGDPDPVSGQPTFDIKNYKKNKYPDVYPAYIYDPFINKESTSAAPDFGKMLPRRFDEPQPKKKPANKTSMEDYQEFQEEFKDIGKKKYDEYKHHFKKIGTKRFKALSAMSSNPDSPDADQRPMWAHQYCLGAGHSHSRPFMEHGCINEMIRENK